MKRQEPSANDIDHYIAEFPEETAFLLRKMREVIAKTAPEAEEKISYRIPTYTLIGHLVHFAAFKKHIGFYPGASAIERFQEELLPYETSKGTVRFPYDKPIPFGLIAQIVAFRVTENLDRYAAKGKLAVKPTDS